MPAPETIPAPDLLPLPGPVWLLKSLLLFGFTLHIIAMNFTVGGAFIAAVSHWHGQRKQSDNHLALARGLARILPYTLAATITLGVAALLFLQVLYGQFFFTSSILMAWPWLMVVPLLIVAYYGVYWYSLSWERERPRPPWVIGASTAIFAAIAWLYTTNILLMLSPGKWQAIYSANPYGLALPFTPCAAVPRYLHFVVAALAVGGLLVVMYGLWERRENPEYGRWAVRQGAKWFTWPTVAQLGVGSWFLFSLPSETTNYFLGKSVWATGLLWGSVFLAVVAMALLPIAGRRENPLAPAAFGIACALMAVAGMAMVRDVVRTAYLSPYFDPEMLPVRVQAGGMAVFLAFFLIGAAVTAYMIRLAARK